MSQLFNQVDLHFRCIIRDRLLAGVGVIAFILLLLVPVFSNFSMRQVQELAITLSLSSISLVLLILALLLGGTSVWRDIERRYTASILTLPVSRGTYLTGKFLAVVIFLFFAAVVLGSASAAVIWLSALAYPSDIPIHWGNIALAIGGEVLKCVLLTAAAFLISTFSTSFFLPFFGTAALFFAGSASQGVYDFITGPSGRDISPWAVTLIKGVYYLIPNLAGFEMKVQAIYGLSVSWAGISLTAVYGTVYTLILLSLAVLSFSRRELP